MKPVAEMTETEKDQIRAWIRNWERVGPILERVRLESLRSVDTADAIAAFDLAYKSARLRLPPRPGSGLVEQQRWFERAHRR
jgi:hypothetical protein